MAKLPPIFQNSTRNMIENNPPEKELPRSYLGMSGIGHPCSRKLFYGFRWTSPKIINTIGDRIFERGHIEEPRVIRDLKRVGIQVFSRINGIVKEIFGLKKDEQEVFIGFAGHAKGHCDGRVLGLIEAPKTEHLLEIKTMKESYWNQLVKSGVKVSHPKYYDQMTRYMHESQETDFPMSRALLIATNKNTEEREYQRIEYDPLRGEMLAEKERTIIISFSPDEFPKLSPNSYECKYCEEFEVCHKDKTPQVNCRTCYYSDMEIDGIWICTKNNNSVLNYEKQLVGCTLYKRLF